MADSLRITKAHRFGWPKFCLIAVFIFILCLLPFLWSCSAKDEVIGKKAAAKMASGFKCTALVDWNGNSYEIQMSRPSAGNCKINFVQPADLNKLSIESGEGVVTIQFGDLGVSVDPDTLPETAMLNVLMNSFDKCITPQNITASSQNGGYVLVGDSASGHFTLTLANDYTPLSLQVPNEQMSIRFKDFQYLST